MEFIVYPDRELLMLGVADRIAAQLGAALRRKDTVSLTVPGGSTPGPVFDMLSGVALDWARVHVVLNDERWVSEDNPRSNTALLRRRLFQGNAAGARLIALHAPGATPEEALVDLTAGLAPHLPLDVALLGMGEDMHTASLFPGADNLAAALADDAPPLMAMRAPGAPEPRLTLTAPVLRGALRLHLLIAGPQKRAALDRARDMAPTEAPVQAILSDATVHWAP